jgi:hypothetical protein
VWLFGNRVFSRAQCAGAHTRLSGPIRHACRSRPCQNGVPTGSRRKTLKPLPAASFFRICAILRESGKSVEAARRRARPTSRQPGVEVGEPAQPRRLYRRKVTRRDCGAPESLKRRNLPAHCTERRAGYFTVKRLLSIHASHGHARSGNFIRSVSSVGKTKLGVTPL